MNIERFVRPWAQLSSLLARRPMQVVLSSVGGLGLIVALSIALFQTAANTTDISQIKSALCAGPHRDPTVAAHHCQHLFDKLLSHPTPAQVNRLREIIKNGN